jgi:hypothetical protein
MPTKAKPKRKMKLKVKKQWLEALRSGKYKQTDGCLRYTDQNGSHGYCCLGVLCDIHAKETKHKWHDDKYFGKPSMLPLDVVRWAGLADVISKQYKDDDEVEVRAGRDKLSILNDDQHTFAEIADIIEKKL